MHNLFRIMVIKGINRCVFICCINFVCYLNCQPYCLLFLTLDTPTLCLCKIYSKTKTKNLYSLINHTLQWYREVTYKNTTQHIHDK